MHASVTFTLLAQPDKNILENLMSEQYLMLRKWVIEMILYTDMAKHFDLIGSLKSKQFSVSEIDRKDCKLETLKLIIHAADIGHSAKEQALHHRWSSLITEEFFNQGELEKSKNYPVSMYCDKDTTIVPKSQIGFLKNIALPLFELLTEYLQSSDINNYCLEQVKSNIGVWEYELSSSKIKTLRVTGFNRATSDNSISPIIGFTSFTPNRKEIK